MLWGSRLVNHLRNQPMRPLGMPVPSQVAPVPPQHLPPSTGSNKGKRQSAHQELWDTRSKGRTPPFFSGLTWFVWVMGFLIIWLDVAKGEESPHQLYKWSLIRRDDQTIIKQVTTAGAPSFLTSLCQLAPISPCLNQKGFYFCPSSNPGRGYCDYPNSYYCAYWGCETIASDWSPGAGQDRFLTVGYGPYGCTPPSRDWSGGIRMPYGNCEQLYVNVTNPTDPAWLVGQTWGVRYWEPGADRGGLIFIKKEEVKNPPQGVGPNKVLEGPKIKLPPFPVATSTVTPVMDNTTPPPTGVVEENPLWKAMQATHDALNETSEH